VKCSEKKLRRQRR